MIETRCYAPRPIGMRLAWTRRASCICITYLLVAHFEARELCFEAGGSARLASGGAGIRGLGVWQTRWSDTLRHNGAKRAQLGRAGERAVAF